MTQIILITLWFLGHYTVSTKQTKTKRNNIRDDCNI